MVLGDYTASNYSNTRNARLEARERAKIHQAKLARVCTSIYLWKIVQWIEAGRLASRGDALRHRWLRPAWAWVDPITEIRASTAAVDAGLTTRTIEAAKLGLDWEEDILPRLRREQELLAENGVALVRSNLTRDPMRAPEPEASPERETVEPE
jgi:capsid protein